MADTQADISEKTLKWRTGRPDAREISPADVPTQSLFALAQRGLSHLGGNEVAAQVAAWKKTEEGKNATEAQVAAKEAEFAAAKLEKLLNGTLGVRVAGAPRVSGIDAIIRSIAVEWLKVALKKQNAKLPTGEDTITVAGKVMNREQLIEAAIRKNSDEFRAEAERRQAAQAEGADVGDLFGE